MTYVITAPCVADYSCLDVCPVDCISPGPEDSRFNNAEQLYIDPQRCVDCGACVEACPVLAIYEADNLPEKWRHYEAINREYFQEPSAEEPKPSANKLDAAISEESSRPEPVAMQPNSSLSGTAASSKVHRIAIVGSGPAGMYACEHLLEHRNLNVEIDLFDRLPTPWGLVRAGVAPDHPEKKMVANRLFDYFFQHPNVRFFGNVEVGQAVSHQELADRYDGVIYAVGASGNRVMNIPGEALEGCWSAREFVAWYNGHPDYSELAFDLSHERAVIVGNGNVALDVARILTTPLGVLRKTDIADHALAALAQSKVKEVVILARRGAAQAAFNNPELEELLHLDNVTVAVEGENIELADAASAALDLQARRKLATLSELSNRRIEKPDKRIVFRFLASPQEVGGAARAEQLSVTLNELAVDDSGQLKARSTSNSYAIDTGLILFATGYRGIALEGLPFDAEKGVIPHSNGRVVDTAGAPIPHTYVTGWIKRGPQGVIGSNKKCAQETVDALIEDICAGVCSTDSNLGDILEELGRRQIKVLSRDDWLAIDRAEREAGMQQGRPRVKFTQRETMLALAAP